MEILSGARHLGIYFVCVHRVLAKRVYQPLSNLGAMLFTPMCIFIAYTHNIRIIIAIYISHYNGGPSKQFLNSNKEENN